MKSETKKLSVKSKIVISLISIIICVALGFLTFFFVAPKIYLAFKYKAPISEFEMVTCTPGHIENVGGTTGLPFDYRRIYTRWQFEHNGRKFNVEYIKYVLYDDYQLEDLEEWCTEYLQNKVDKDIVGIFLETALLYDYPNISCDEIQSIKSNKYIEKEDIETFIKNASINYLYIYYLNSELDDSVPKFSKSKELNEFSDEKAKNIKNRLGLSENSKVIVGCISEKSDIVADNDTYWFQGRREIKYINNNN